MKNWQSRASGLLLFVGLLAFAPTASAQWTLLDEEQTEITLGANLQMLSAYVVLPQFDTPEGFPEFPTEAGLGSAVGRLEWSARFGDRVSLDVHNRFIWQASTVEQEALQQGFGVTRGVDRRINTRYELIDGETTQLVHDLDRFVFGVFFPGFDLYLGRQAISWGVSELFRVADRFAPLSPFELDTLQRRGIDAARLVTHLTPSLELDLVVADRGPDEPLSIAGRMEYFGASFDVYGGVGRFYERISALGGVSYLAGNWKVFAEGEGLYNLEEAGLDRPRATVGVQRVAMQWQIGAEYHYNGFGAADSDGYLARLESPEFQRGESYFLGRHYAGLTSFYGSDAGWGVGGGAMVNLIDPSVVIFPVLSYDVHEQLSVAAGAYVGFGEAASIALEGLSPVLELGSEYGSFSDMYFIQMTAFF